MDKVCGIYCVENNINHKKYVGLSKDCLKRWNDHYSKSYHSSKDDDKRKPLYLAMRKYGRENFSFSILEECEEELLKEREIYWIDKLNTYATGYNATLGGDLPQGHVLSEEEHGMAKLTLKEVEECRKMYMEGKRSRDVWEEKYKDRIKYSGFSKMWHGRTWRNVMPEVFLNNPHPARKISEEDVIKIKELYRSSWSCAKIYHYFNEKFSRTSINDICHNRRYNNIN